MQEANISAIKADRSIRRTLNLIEHIKQNKGTYEKETEKIINTKSYNIPFKINIKRRSIIYSKGKVP